MHSCVLTSSHEYMLSLSCNWKHAIVEAECFMVNTLKIINSSATRMNVGQVEQSKTVKPSSRIIFGNVSRNTSAVLLVNYNTTSRTSECTIVTDIWKLFFALWFLSITCCWWLPGHWYAVAKVFWEDFTIVVAKLPNQKRPSPILYDIHMIFCFAPKQSKAHLFQKTAKYSFTSALARTTNNYSAFENPFEFSHLRQWQRSLL